MIIGFQIYSCSLVICWYQTVPHEQTIPYTPKLCLARHSCQYVYCTKCVSMKLWFKKKHHIQSTTMTSEQIMWMFLKAGPYHETSDDLYTEIIRYCLTMDNPFLKQEMTVEIASATTHTRTLFAHSMWKKKISHCKLGWDTGFTLPSTYM